ncbi:MAG: hypothetical protein V2B18_11715 [Pseudomonadota bacterium]
MRERSRGFERPFPSLRKGDGRPDVPSSPDLRRWLEVWPLSGAMNGRPNLLLAVLAVLFLGPTGVVDAWTFKMDSGLFEFRYEYYSQGGHDGFFGQYNVDEGATGGDQAVINGWLGKTTVSGTTASRSAIRFIAFPSLHLNQAVSVRGTYVIGPYTTESALLGVDQETETFLAEGKWSRLWVQIDSPWGRLFMGKRAFRQGCGLQFGAGDKAEELSETGRRSEESVTLEAFYKPLTIGLGFYPWRRGSERYWNRDDHNASRSYHLLSYLRYSAGQVDAGIGGFFWSFNEGPEGGTSVSERNTRPPSTTNATEGWIYLKYNNGFFFANAEADWYYRTIRYQASGSGAFFEDTAVIPGGGGSFIAPRYIESWRYMTEFGIVLGPTKMTFLHSHMPGPDRRHGVYIDRQPFVQALERSAYGVYYPYCLLMAKIYNAGVDSPRDMSDSDVFAGSIEYMVASNLSVAAMVTRAMRASHGYGWGYVRPDALKFGSVVFKDPGTYLDPAPAVPDNDLGWEIDVNLTWKLLENWELDLRLAKWWPGNWFRHAFVDKGVRNWDVPEIADNFGANPARSIDSVMGVELFIRTKM